MKPLDEAMRRAFGAAGASAVTLSSHAVEKAVKAAIASLAADGWELVPREATQEMREAGMEAAPMFLRDDEYKRRIRSSPSTTDCATIYDAMLAAAPKVTP